MLVGVLGGMIFLIFGTRKFLESKAFKRLTLQTELTTQEGYTSTFFKESMVGKSGIAYTVLRPSGKILVGDEIFDAYSRNEFIEKGSEVIIIEESTTSLKVKKKE
jgi:membrane-bound serine protease (ClpP class)